MIKKGGVPHALGYGMPCDAPPRPATARRSLQYFLLFLFFCIIKIFFHISPDCAELGLDYLGCTLDPHWLDYRANLAAAAAEVGRRRGKTYHEVQEWTEQCQARKANVLQELNRTYIAHKKSELLEQADPVNHQRLVSVMSGKANLWTTGAGYAKRMPKAVFRAGLHVSLGIPVQPRPHLCKCGMTADTLGNHFANCRLIPKRTQCHNYWRDMMADIIRMTGKTVHVEVAPEGKRERPADIFQPVGKDGKPNAIDLAISAAVEPAAPDRIAQTKNIKYKEMCKKMGWNFIPVVGDAYGAVRGDGAAFINSVVKELTQKLGMSWPAPSTMVWRTVTTCLLRRRAEAIAEAWSEGLVSSEMEEWDFSGMETAEGDNEMEGTVEEVSAVGGACISTAQLLPQGDDILPDFEEEEYHSRIPTPLFLNNDEVEYEPESPPPMEEEMYDPEAPMVEEGFEGEL
jgi:hypothetical protein